MIEGLIAWICLFAYIFSGNIEFLKICGIFAVAVELFNLKESLKGNKTINLYTWFSNEGNLNDAVEIIEEDKQENEIQLIEYNLDADTLKTFIKGKYVFVEIPENYRYLIDFYKNKINELTDEINKLKKNK